MMNPSTPPPVSLKRRVDRDFTLAPPKTQATAEKMDRMRAHFKRMATIVASDCPSSREQNKAISKLEEALFWAIGAIARNQRDPRPDEAPPSPAEAPSSLTVITAVEVASIADESPGLLTLAERCLLADLGAIANAFGKVIGSDSRTRRSDMNEAVVLIHGLQNMVMAQAAARAYPSEFRLMGSVVPPRSEP